jgi:PelA/Pel-15E family pectate lyase
MPAFLAIVLALLTISGRAAPSWKDFDRKPAAWWNSVEARAFGTNILSWQSDRGSWPKNTDTYSKAHDGSRGRLQGTFDNSATTRELRYLARLFTATKETPFREAFLRGYNHILSAQYPNGGWPQYHPAPAGSYARHITFNDNAMTRILEFLRESWDHPQYAFLEEGLRERSRRAFDRGVECILKCQIRVRGELTAWCAQHDAVTLEPRPARAYELVSLSGAESTAIVNFLMTLDEPSPAVVAAVAAAVRWFETAKIPGIKVVREEDARSPTGLNKVVARDPSARPMWARFYQIETNRPMFVDRDGQPKDDLADIGFERRNGYGWLGYWPEAPLKNYPAWREKVASRRAERPNSN